MLKNFPLIKTLLAILPLTLSPVVQAGPLPVSDDGRIVTTIAPMLDEVTPAVVHIATAGRQIVRGRSFFNRGQLYERPTQGLGSGVIVDAKKGIVITNSHVIEDADKINVKLKDGREFEAEVLGQDPDTDIAVLRIEADSLTSIPRARSENIKVGDFVVAIGTPFGLEQTVTSGIISALGRSGLGIERYENFIQTDASINPGNSGGALVNLHGQLVGINTAILGGGGGSIGIGFAIPISMVESISQQLIEYGEVRRGMLGVNIAPFTPEFADYFNVPEDIVGAIVTNVSDDSPAEKAGIEREDIIVAIDDRPVRSTSDLVNRIGLMKAGDKVKVSFYRNGKLRDKTVKIASQRQESVRGSKLSEALEGASLTEIDNTNGMLVESVEAGSKAEASGLNEGDIVLEVNRRKVNSIEDVNQALATRNDGILLTLERGGFVLYLLLR